MENAILNAEEFMVPRDLFLSPYLAPDNMLANMPPMKILVRV